jgi:hypothetical protein
VKLNPTRIAEILGKPKPEAERPTTPEGHALAELDALQQRVDDHVESVRQPGETSARAYDRTMRENPTLAAEHSRMIDEIKNRHLGVQGQAQPLGAIRKNY